MNQSSTSEVRFALKGLALATALLWGSHAAALGLGRLTVLSALGETLRAEVEVTSITAEEAASLTLRVASPEAYRAAGVEYNPVLPGASVQVVRRPDGRSVLRVTSDRAVLEPFVDVIIEANWASGRLVREYTMLFDPPGSRTAQPAGTSGTAPLFSAAPGGAAPAVASPVAPQPGSVATAPIPAPVPGLALPPAVAAQRPRPAAAAAPVAAPQPSSEGTTEADRYRVLKGDTLSRIAGRTQRPGVSLDQMLVGLFRANPQAFVAENMNRLLAGTVLTVPSTEESKAVSPEGAREIIATQSADFGAYRQRLASGTNTAADNEPPRVAKGRVQTTVDDRKQSAAVTPDRLTLSRPANPGTAPEAKVSKDTERKDNDARLAELARNVDELKKLQGSTAPAAKMAAPAAPAAPAPAAAAAPAPAAAPTVVAAAPVPAPVPSPLPAPAPVAPLLPPPPALPAPVVASAPVVMPAPAPKVVAPPPAAVAESEAPGLLSGLSDNSFVLPAAGVLVALLAGLGLYRLRSKMRKPAGETSFLESRLQPDSFFGASGGQRVDTHEAAAGAPASSSMSYSLSQLDAIGDVDPVAEADVYLAYGRDLQAEEILKEAMRATPERLAIRNKLLEVYAKRRDTKGYELLATQVYAITNGSGEDWAKAQAQGLTIDPENPLYRRGGAPEEVRGKSGKVVEALGASTLPYTAPVVTAFQPAVDATLDGPDLDLDLDRPNSSKPLASHEATQAFAADARLSEYSDLDFDLGQAVPPAAPARLAPGRPLVAGAGTIAAAGAAASGFAAQPLKEAARTATPAVDDLDFDLGSLDAEGPATAPLPADTSVDFDDFDLDAPAPAGSADGDPLSRKLELADEFRQIGDLEGARDLLEEVLAKASGVLKTKAQGMLDQLG